MTTYRILLVITAACSALITAVFINPVGLEREYAEPMQLLLPPALLQAPETSDNEVIENAEPLTLAIKICTQTKCEYLAMSDAENLLIVEDESATESEQYQTTVPFQLPQRGVPIIEM